MAQAASASVSVHHDSMAPEQIQVWFAIGPEMLWRGIDCPKFIEEQLLNSFEFVVQETTDQALRLTCVAPDYRASAVDMRRS